MSNYSSTKLLWHLVTEQSLQASDDVLFSELDRQRPLLAQGLVFFATPSRQSREAFLAKRGKKTETGKLTQFILQLSQLLGVEEGLTQQILGAYLAGDFRGTKQSLKKLIEEDRFQRPLLLDIWQFYRAERLHLLQVLKEILSHASDLDHPHSSQFGVTLQVLREADGLRKSLVKQMESVMTEVVPSRETNGKHFSDQCQKSWCHFNLREQAELLQLNLLFLYTCSDSSSETGKETFTELFQLFINHGFGHRQNSSHLLADVSHELVDSVGHLEALTLIYLIDLPGLTAGSLNTHSLWRSSADVGEIDRLITSLGNCPDHGPIMLAWMLAHYLGDGEESLAKYHGLGERAVQMRAVNFLIRVLGNEVIASNATVRAISRGICYALLSVLTSAFEPKRTGLAADVQHLCQLVFRQESIAMDFWKQGYEVGLGTHFAALLTSFPVDLKPLCHLAADLAMAGSRSADLVLSCFEEMSVYAEQLDLVPTAHLSKKGSDRWQLLMNRYPIPEVTKDIVISAGTFGVSDGRLFKWQTAGFNGWRFLLAEIDRLIRQISSGAKNISQDTMTNVMAITKLLDAVQRNSSKALKSLGLIFSERIFALVEKLAHMPDPPLLLLAHCLRALSLVADEKPRLVWDRLSEFGLFPFFTRSAVSVVPALSDVNPGLVGALLAQQECVNGEYPLTSAFLDLLLNCSRSDDVSEIHPTTASIVYLVQDIFPSFRQWRFANPTEKEVFGQKMLRLFQALLTEKSGTPKKLQALLCRGLLQPAPLASLVRIVGTGDRQIQSLMEAQSSWECGLGVELASLVNLALTVFDSLLGKTDLGDLEDIGKLLCSPSAGGAQPHFLLTVAHYVYHVQSFELPISAMKLLASIARMFPMSLLACLGSDAEAFRDILIFRLESKTEDVALKVAIIDFFSACVDAQPGLIQLLIGIRDVSIVVSVGQKPLTDAEKLRNDSAKLVSDSGCLKSILAMLADDASSRNNPKLEMLHLSVMNFVLHLWQCQRIVAIAHLKQHSSFWSDLTWSIFDDDLADGKKTALNSRVLRILSNEIYTFGSKVDANLIKVLERLCDEKKGHFSDWFSFVLSTIQSSHSLNTEEMAAADLLGAWKSFMIVLTHEQPVSLSPGQCHLVASRLVKALREQLACDDDQQQDARTRIITSLGELSLVLMRRWQTKCADNMVDWCREQGLLLEDLASAFDRLHPRARAAILGVANTALKTSNFKLNKDDAVLESWLEPSATIVQRSFVHHDHSSAHPDKTFQHVHVPILALSLLRNLVHRLLPDTNWFGVLHRQVLVQSLLSQLHHSLRNSQKGTELPQGVLSLLLLLAKTDVGCRALLSSDLAQTIWLPLSDVRQANKVWIPVFQLSLQLISALLRRGKHDAVENCVTVVALLQEQLTTFLLAPKFSVQASHVELTVTAASFISLFMGYHKQWHLQHSATLLHFYRTMCTLLHISVCLLLRPSLLGLLINRDQSQCSELHQPSADDELEQQRVRRMSSTDQEVEACSPESVSIQDALLDAVAAGLGMLRALSPDLVDLAAGNVDDRAQFDQLLGIGFGTPTFEQEGVLTYGTLISISNICIRSVTRGDRSPSPAPLRSASASSPQPPRTAAGGHQMDRRRLLLVLEQSLLVLLSQALLCFSDPRYSPRDSQLLRRELGAEFSSVLESMRRYMHRGAKSPQTVLAGSPAPLGGAATVTGTRLGKSDEQFMKVIASIAQNVFK